MKRHRALELDKRFRQLQNFLSTADPADIAEKQRHYEKYLQEEQQFRLDYPIDPPARPAQSQAGAGAIDPGAYLSQSDDQYEQVDLSNS